MDWVADAIALLAAGVAVWQAVQARSQRREAEVASAKAEQQADRSLVQAQRAVDAQQGIAEAVSRLGQRDEPWELSPEDFDGTYRLTNKGSRRVISSRAVLLDRDGSSAGGSTGTWIMSEPMEWAKAAFELLSINDFGSLVQPGLPKLTVWWREVDDTDDTPDRVWSQILR